MDKVTTDFAIKYLLDDCDDCSEKTDDNECISQSYCFEVKRMVIRALKQMNALDKIRAEIEQEYIRFHNKSDMWSERACGLGTALEIIDKYKKEVRI